MNKSEPPASAGGQKLGLRPREGNGQRRVTVSTPDNRGESGNSANWPPTHAGGSDLINACAAAADELVASRTLIGTLESENTALKTRLETERRTTAILTELDATRRSETDALRTAIAAKNETIAAKDVALAAQDKLITTLKTKRPSPWQRLGDILIGAAVIAVLK